MKERETIRILIADYKKLGLNKTWEGLLPHLSVPEREKALRYRFDADRIRSVTGACLIKAGTRGAYPDGDFRIRVTELGKPYVEGRSGYEFNLSHSGSIIAFAEDEAKVGIDVELIKNKDWRIFHRYLTGSEMSMIESSGDPEACFFDVWTTREAFAKEEGLGLKILDEEFTVDYKIHEISYDSRRLYFKLFDHTADERYKICVCSPHDVSDAQIEALSGADWEDIVRRITHL